MLEQLFTISRNTFLESIRQPIFVVLLMVGAMVLILNPAVAAYTMDDDNKLMIDMGLSTLFVIGVLLAAFTATGVVSTEVENRTVLTVVSKPVPRPLFVLGKYLGVGVALTLAFWVLGGLFLLSARHGVLQTAGDAFDMPVVLAAFIAWAGALAVGALGNYFYRWVFTSSFVLSLALLTIPAVLLMLLVGKGWHFQSISTEFGLEGAARGGRLLVVMLLVLQAIWVLTAVAIAASTRLGQLMTLMVCAGVFLLGLVSETLIQPAVARLPWGEVTSLGSLIGFLLARLASIAVPNLQFLWLVDTLPQGLPIPADHVGLLTIYALLQIGAVLCLATALFQTREVG